MCFAAWDVFGNQAGHNARLAASSPLLLGSPGQPSRDYCVRVFVFVFACVRGRVRVRVCVRVRVRARARVCVCVRVRV